MFGLVCVKAPWRLLRGMPRAPVTLQIRRFIGIRDRADSIRNHLGVRDVPRITPESRLDAMWPSANTRYLNVRAGGRLWFSASAMPWMVHTIGSLLILATPLIQAASCARSRQLVLHRTAERDARCEKPAYELGCET